MAPGGVLKRDVSVLPYSVAEHSPRAFKCRTKNAAAMSEGSTIRQTRVLSLSILPGNCWAFLDTSRSCEDSSYFTPIFALVQSSNVPRAAVSSPTAPEPNSTTALARNLADPTMHLYISATSPPPPPPPFPLISCDLRKPGRPTP